MRKQILLASLFVAAMASCGNQAPATDNASNNSCSESNVTASCNDLFDKNWAVVEINGKAVEYQTEGAHLTFDSKSNSVTGNAGCNVLNCSFTVDGNKLNIQEGALTKMMCPDQENEDAFIGVIHKVQSYQISNDTLSLFNADNNKVLALVKK